MEKIKKYHYHYKKYQIIITNSEISSKVLKKEITLVHVHKFRVNINLLPSQPYFCVKRERADLTGLELKLTCQSTLLSTLHVVSPNFKIVSQAII